MPNLSDVRGQYMFNTYKRFGKTYKQAYGWLGMPDHVIQYRSSSAHNALNTTAGERSDFHAPFVRL